HYLELGLIEEPPREPNGYRIFDASHVVQILRIKLLTESGASLHHVAQILENKGTPSLEDIDIIEKEITRKESVLSQQRAALESLRVNILTKSQSQTAQFDTDVGLLMSEPQLLPAATNELIQDTLNSPDVAALAKNLESNFAALEGQNSITEDAATKLAREFVDFYHVLASQLDSIPQVTHSPIPGFINELRTGRLSPAQSIVWEKFLARIED